MRRVLFLAFAMVWLTVLASAQVPTSGNVFFGYSYYSTKLSSLDRANTNGWEGSLEGKVAPFVGLVADFSGHYGSQTFEILNPPCPTSGCGPLIFRADVTEHNILFGPRLSVSAGKFHPFAEALFGAGHVSANSFGSSTSFATALGGGLDYRIFRPLAWRFQGDYVHTHLFGAGQSNLRLSTGIVLRF